MSDNSDFLSGQSPQKSFKDIFSKDDAKPPTHPASDYANIPLTLNSFEILEGSVEQDGERKKYKYAVLECMDSSLETFYVRCSGYIVIRQLEGIKQAVDLPCFMTLKKDKDGKTWYLD